MISLKEIEVFFNEYDYSNNVLSLDGHGYIKNLKNFVKSHISYLKSNPKNKGYKPYYDRLLKVYLKLNQNGNNRNNL